MSDEARAGQRPMSRRDALMGKGGKGTIFVNGEKVAEGRIDRTQANLFSADEGADVGLDGETPVTDDSPTGLARSPSS